MAPLCGKKKVLTFMTCSFACMGLLLLCVSVATDYWLYTYERDSRTNGTTVYITHSGLWRKCSTTKFFSSMTKQSKWDWDLVRSTGPTGNCSYIPYFQKKSDQDLKPPEAIMYDSQAATIFPVSGLVLVMIGCTLAFIGFFEKKVHILIFVSGGLFVFSGICLLIGIVLYVGSISQAFDSKSSSLKADARYLYKYGTSFYLTVMSFIFCKFAGTSAVYSYVARYRHYHRIKHQTVPISDTYNYTTEPNSLCNRSHHHPVNNFVVQQSCLDQYQVNDRGYQNSLDVDHAAASTLPPEEQHCICAQSNVLMQEHQYHGYRPDVESLLITTV